ncbi:MAG: tetratricopeptide repeat protein [Ignavibacteria bacterium]|jgi:tetratricopeptide (TPR) repeat protein
MVNIFSAIEFEKEGKVDKAIELYENIIASNFDGNHPYDRLAVIYRKRGQINDEIRVLNKAIWVFKNVASNKRMDRIPKLEKFQNRLNKAIKLNNQSK